MPQQETDVVLGWEMACRITQLIYAPDPVNPQFSIITGIAPIGRFFGITGGSILMDSDKHECGDSLSGIRKRYKAGRSSFACSMKFYEKDDVLIFQTPVQPVPPATVPTGGFQLFNGSRIYLEVFTQGTDDLGNLQSPYTATNFVCFTAGLDFDEEGKITGHLDGMADGNWYRPGEVIPP